MIVVATILIYIPSLNGSFIWDDNDIYITQNQGIKASDGLYRFWFTTQAAEYYPVSNSTFWIEWRLWGMNPIGYHATNLILHIVGAMLIWGVLHKLSIPGAFMTGLIFAIHPVNVESVAWIAERKDVLAMLFFLVSIWCYSNYEIPSPLTSYRSALSSVHSPLTTVRPSLFYWLSLASFVLGMLSKGSIAVLPALLLGIIWWLRPLTRWDLIRTVPFFIISIVLTCVNISFQIRGSEDVIRSASFTERLLDAGIVVWFYLYKALLPINLSFFYPMWHIQVGNPLWWLPLLAAMIVTSILWRYRKTWSRSLLFAWVFFCVALVPVMGFADVYFMKYSLVADHYQHMAIIGVIALASALWSIWRQRLRRAVHYSATFIAIATIGSLSFLTWQQNGFYCNELTLYQDTLKKNPDCWLAHNNLGVLLYKAGLLRESMDHYRESLRLKPDYFNAQNNLAAVLMKTGRTQEALEHYQQALSLKPHYPEAYFNLGLALQQVGRLQEAIECFRRAIKVNGNYFEVHYTLGDILLKAGRPQEAIEYYQQALHLRPDNTTVRDNLGVALIKADRLQEAINLYEQAVQRETQRRRCPQQPGLRPE